MEARTAVSHQLEIDECVLLQTSSGPPVLFTYSTLGKQPNPCRIWKVFTLISQDFDKAPVAQLDSASASEAEGCGFEPRRAYLV
jgi:hypothetical protein